MTESLWQHCLDDLAAGLAACIEPGSAAEAGCALWWGATCTELLEAWAPLWPGALRLAESDPRLLRRAAAAAGSRGAPLRLVDLKSLRLDVAGLEDALGAAPVRGLDAYLAMQERIDQLAHGRPAVADASVSLLVMDMMLNRVGPQALDGLLQEAFRVMPRHGRMACTVLMTDEPVTGAHAVRQAPGGMKLHLPSENVLLAAVERAGFHGLGLRFASTDNPAALDRVEGADLRSVLLTAFKGKQGPCYELGQAVIYQGPWREVADDDGHLYPRGARVAVCAKTYELLMRPPYAGHFMGLRSVKEPALGQAQLFDCHTPALRSPAVTKGLADFAGAVAPAASCAPGSGCC